MRVSAVHVTVDIEDVRVVTDVSLDAPPGSVVAVVGPNGSGKSTLLRAVYRTLRPASGVILVDGDDVWQLPARTSAQRTAVVLQHDSVDFEFTVRETVELGRVPHRRLLDRPTTRDHAAVADALARTGIAQLTDRYVATLSGGERQRTYLARALAQQTPILILDEPTNHLDLLAQTELLELLTELPTTVIVALHDLNLAASHADRVVVLDSGSVVAAGSPDEVLTPELIEATYGVRTEVAVNALTGRRVLHFGPAVRRRGATPDPTTLGRPEASTPSTRTPR